MRRIKEDEFIRAYCAAYKAGLTRDEFEKQKRSPDNPDYKDVDGRYDPKNRDPEDLAEGGK